jgi:hypothetical protein
MFRLATLVNLLLALLAVETAQAQVETFARLSPDERIIRLWKEAPVENRDTVLVNQWFERVQAQAKELRDERMYWYVALFRILHRVTYQSNSGQPVTAYDDAAAFVETIPVEIVRASFYCLHGQDQLRRHRNVDKGLKLLLRAKFIFEKIGYERIPEAILYLQIFGAEYYWFEDYRMSVHYMELTAKFRSDAVVKQYFCQNTLALAYMQLKEYGKALKSFQNVIRFAEGKSTEWVGIGSNGYGNTLRLMGKHHAALPYLYRDVGLNSVRVPESAALSCVFIARSLLALDSTAKAKEYIDKARKLYNGYVFSPYWVNYYEAQTAYHRKTGHQQKTILYLDSTIALKDSLKAVFGSRALSLAEGRSKAERYLSDIVRTEAEKQRAIWLRNGIIVTLALFALLGLYALNQQRQKLQREKQIEEEQRKRADEQLAHAQAQLGQYLTNLKQKNDFIARISDELVLARQESPEQAARQQQQTNTLLKSVILTDTDWQQFRQLFDQVHPRFFETLRATYPDLTPAEIRLLALLKLNISPKEMAFMLGVSPESVRKLRYRLRKKLEVLPPEVTFSGLISQL